MVSNATPGSATTIGSGYSLPPNQVRQTWNVSAVIRAFCRLPRSVSLKSSMTSCPSPPNPSGRFDAFGGVRSGVRYFLVVSEPNEKRRICCGAFTSPAFGPVFARLRKCHPAMLTAFVSTGRAGGLNVRISRPFSSSKRIFQPCRVGPRTNARPPTLWVNVPPSETRPLNSFDAHPGSPPQVCVARAGDTRQMPINTRHMMRISF